MLWRAVLVWLAVGIAAPAHALSDALQWQWRAAHELPVHWDNVEGPDQWLEGIRPRYTRQRKLHSIELQPGDWSTIELPAGQWLRVLSLQGALAVEDLQLMRSADGLLYAPERMQASEDGSSLLTIDLHGSVGWLRIERPLSADGPVQLAVFVSRQPPVGEVPAYVQPLGTDSGAQAVRLSERRGGETYWQLNAGQPASLTVHGPQRLELRSRLILAPHTRSAEQPYRIEASLDGAMLQVLEPETMDERRDVVSVAGCIEPLGSARTGYVDVPRGEHRLTLRASRSLYLRVMGSRGNGDYAFDGNAPELPVIALQTGQQPSLWSIVRSAFGRLFDDATPVPEAERIAQRLARDNHWEAASLLAAEGLAGGRGYSAEALARYRLAARRGAALRHYSDLLPQPGAAVFAQRTLSFSMPSLAENVEPELLWRAQLPRLAAGVAQGHFTETPADPDRALRYLLPERSHDTQLRLVVASEGPLANAELFVQFDDEQVHRVRVQDTATSAAVTLRPDASSLAAALLQSREEAAPVQALARLPWGQLHLPAGARSVRVWAAQGSLWTALQLAEAAAYLGGEEDYRAALEAVGQQQALSRFLADLAESAPQAAARATQRGTAAEAELDNLWLPLMRYLRAQSRYFAGGLPTPSRAAQQGSIDASRAQAYRRSAEQAEQQADWLRAIELWSLAMQGPDVEARDAARLRRAQALRAQGEGLLANQELWRLYRDTGSDALRNTALDALMRDADSGGDMERGVRIVASALLVRPAPELVQRLVPLLAEAGRSREALQLALLLPPEHQPLASVLRAARDAGWWSVFEQALTQLPAVEQVNFWSGWSALARGEAGQALALWSQAGAAGSGAAQRLRSALQIRAGLNAAATEKRARAVLDWEQWQAQALAEGSWRQASETVVQHAGSATLVLPELGLQLPRYRSAPTQPLHLAVYGPTRLRVSLRPLYAAGWETPVDDWLMVKTDSALQRFPITGNAPDPERHMLGEPGFAIGQREQVILEVGPGYHRLQLRLRDGDALVAVETLQPDGFEAVLPMLTPQAVQDVLAQPADQHLAVSAHWSWPVELAGECRVKDLEVAVPVAAVPPAPDPVVFSRLNTGRPTRPLSGQPEVQAELADLLWQGEQDRHRLPELAARAETVYASAVDRSGLHPVMQRLRRDLDWQPLTNLWQRAGEHDVPLPYAMPEHPAARLRHALLGPLPPGHQRLGGRSTLVFSLEQPRPVDFAFDFALESLLDRSPAPLRVAIQVDSAPERVVRLTSQQPQGSYRLTVAGGAHSVRIRLLDPLARHSVRVAARERQPDGGWMVHALHAPSRSYHVASVDEPLVVFAQGPGLVRVDQWSGEGIESRYRQVEPGWQKLVLPPSAGRDEALYRVFMLTVQAPDTPLPVQLPRTAAEPLSPPLPRHRMPAARPSLHDTLPLGGQEDGTLSGTLELASRRNLDEDRDLGSDAERFVELRATHRKYLQQSAAYHRFDALWRTREHGGPTLGVGEFLSLPTAWHELELDVSGSFYAQQPGGGAGTDWLGEVRGRASRRLDLGARLYHRPAVLLFRRWMSRDEGLEEEPERIDQDVYTRYKRDHRQGVQLGEDLFYRPWADVAGWLGARVVSNEAFNIFDPDHVRGRVGARWLLRDWQLEAQYSATHYFADADRYTGLTRELMRVEAQLLRWNDPGNGLQLGLRLDQDLDSNDNSLWLTLSWHRANGRLLRDFHPGDLNFRGLRQRQINTRLFGAQRGGRS